MYIKYSAWHVERAQGTVVFPKKPEQDLRDGRAGV